MFRILAETIDARMKHPAQSAKLSPIKELGEQSRGTGGNGDQSR